jgi:transcriptional regulator of acetoin/glycerol metabolism
MTELSAMRHADRVLAVVQDDTMTTDIAASWRRCLLTYRLDPERAEPPTLVSAAEVRHARDGAGRMLRLADPELDRLHALVRGIGYSVLMTDRMGTTVARRVADTDAGGCRYWRLWTGSVWSEDVEGTNGVGTCLAEERSVSIHRGQHFRRRHTALTCSVAPLFDASGRVAGALDISSFTPDADGRLLPLAMAAVQEAARRIESACFHAAFAGSLILSLPRPDGADDGSVVLLALDADRRILGATRGARVALQLDDRQLEAGLQLGDAGNGLLGQPRSFGEAERLVIMGALSQAQNNVTVAASLLGISRATLHRKIKELGLQRRPGLR